MDKKIVYVIIGKDTETLIPEIKKRHLQKKVFLLPELEHETIKKCYQSAWCFFSPSLSEGMSLVSIEAMASGLPLIVTNVPGNIDIVRSNDCGIVVENKNPDSMASGIKTLLSDNNLYSRLSKQAACKARDYDWASIATRYISLFELLLSKKKI